MMNAVRHEWLIVRREPAFRWATVLILLLTAAALFSGYAFKQERDRKAAIAIAQSVEKRAADKITIDREAKGQVPFNPWGPSEPTRAEWTAARTSGPLAHLSSGSEDVHPVSAKVSLWMTRDDTLFKKYEFDSPFALSYGRFDPTTLVIYLLPLATLALLFNLVASERASGRLQLAAVQDAGNERRLLLRALLRLAPVFLALALVFVGAIVLGGPLARVILWIAGSLLYVLFWAAIAVCIACLPFRQEALAATAGIVWLAVVVVLPAAVAMTVTVLHAPVTAVDRINATREVERAINQNLDARLSAFFENDSRYPAFPPGADTWAAKLYLSQREADRRLAPMRERWQRAAESRQRLQDRLAALSPALTASRLLACVAGTDQVRQDAFERQTEAFLKHWQDSQSPRIFRRERLAPHDIDGLPRFDFQEPAIAAASVAMTMGTLGIFLLVASVTAGRMVRRIRFA